MSEYRNRTICVDKHEIVVDRYSEIHISLNKGKVIQVEGLPDEWDLEQYGLEFICKVVWNG